VSTEQRQVIEVGGTPVEVVRKAIKNLHLGVYPPSGRVRVAVPLHVGDEAVRLAVATRLPWIRRQQRAFAAQARQSERAMTSGESHYVFGRRYRLRVVEADATPTVVLQGHSHLRLQVRPGTPAERREELLYRWYRQQLRERAAVLIEHWAPILGVEVAEWGIRRMKTRWGSCNPAARRIWLNLELAKKPLQCVEYIVVHEMVHLLERHHTDRFRELMETYLPQWRLYRDELNRAPLAHEEWQY
jgi:predicted metal-dependent hydrolase